MLSSKSTTQLSLRRPNIVTHLLLVVSIILSVQGTKHHNHIELFNDVDSGELLHGEFPKGFLWGIGTSAFQTEGADAEEGKGESIWDRFTKEHPERIADKSNASVACDSYHKYKEDVKLIKLIGAKAYRFSISWSRILPKGNTEVVNKEGLAFYENLINELLANNIEPIVCLHHWDLPQNLQESGGWLNKGTVESFGEYARLMFKTFGDRVKRWITINEPFSFCYYGYGRGYLAPGVKDDPAKNPYSCVHSLIMGHALAYQIYKGEFAQQQRGKVGLTLDSIWQFPANSSSDRDIQAAHQSYEFIFDWIAYPLFNGEYPPVMRQIIDQKSTKEGLKQSRLPHFDAEWRNRVKGSLDFLGINHFTSQIVQFSNESSSLVPSWEGDSGTVRNFDPKWPPTGTKWIKIVPEGLRRCLNKIKEDYGNPEVMIAENGVSDASESESFSSRHGLRINDQQRVEYHRLYINEVLKAIHIDGCNVSGYFAWSLLDGFEWSRGYTEKFGVVKVDHQSPNRTRIPKKSFGALQKIFKDNGFLPLAKTTQPLKVSAVSISSTIDNPPEGSLSISKSLRGRGPVRILFPLDFMYNLY